MTVLVERRPAWLRSIALLAETDKDGNILVTATVDETTATTHLWGNLTLVIDPRSRRIVGVARLAEGWARQVPPSLLPPALVHLARSMVLDCSRSLVRS